MDSLWETLTNFAPAQAAAHSNKQLDLAIKDHIVAVNRLVTSQRQLISTNARQILQRLDPATDSISFLAILNLSLELSTTTPGIDKTSLLDETLRFLLNFNPVQVRYVGSMLRRLLEHVATGRLFTPLVSVEAIATALLRIDPTGSMFTSTHLTLVKCAYHSSWIEPALKVLDRDITFYPGMAGQKDSRLLCDNTLAPTSYISTETGLTDQIRSATVLEYNLASGLCYISRKDWTNAQRALERAITHPSKDKGVSKMMDEAYKKWLLVSLLKDGEASDVPAYTPLPAKNAYSALGTAYRNVAAQFPTINVGQLKIEVESNQKVWEDDGNTTLVAEVVAAYPKWQIIKLRDIYKQVSISQLRQVTLSAETGEILKDNEDATKLVRDMIESGLLKGELQLGSSGDDSYLLFHDDSESMTEEAFAQEIAQRHHNIEILGKQYKTTNERLGSSREYVRHVAREQKRADKEADPGVGFDSQIEDEDLMTGIMAHG
ncbi:uncharacterized protein NECHADRAFT_41236 [Fusarium vanettenii 77-13-4]|uniref:COP9 signalosome complex subunit 3 N-terminal helical repeats domain-containing protein n=1 Tax=Fusarium vanettenii (strain ATCC MYA-4622 / CBS 123669 / FGSC 9596 / NRRL 45880 / 77-13-4) TaxID=660122 RepID=C7YRQ1_FUSV7|nr:uncharacterized protein NECHADRAFT_41236 [Fusarium vanettenii 77-13-4]EEU45112.1 hypothetical protein NECHADRAFT_41236 [Fusarium vanettenii 77-13-4]